MSQLKNNLPTMNVHPSEESLSSLIPRFRGLFRGAPLHCPLPRMNNQTPEAYIDVLPVEILSEIFRHSCDPRRVYEDGLFKSTRRSREMIKTIVTIMCVCRTWRKIAKNQGELWRNIIATPHFTKMGWNDNNSCRDIEQFLERSRQYPLHALIDTREPGCEYMAQPVENETPDERSQREWTVYARLKGEMPYAYAGLYQTLPPILQHIGRLQSLSIVTVTWNPMHDALRILQSGMAAVVAPKLETLCLQHCDPDFEPERLKFIQFPKREALDAVIFPCLTTLKLDGVHLNWAGLADSLSKSPLETFQLKNIYARVSPSLANLKTLFEAIPLLKTLLFENFGIPQLDLHTAPILLDSLTDLSISYTTDIVANATRIFQLLDTPKLKSLTLTGSNNLDSTDVDATYNDYLLDFLTRDEPHHPRFSKLQRLIFEQIVFSKRTLTELLRITPQIRTIGTWGQTKTAYELMDILITWSGLTVLKREYNSKDGTWTSTQIITNALKQVWDLCTTPQSAEMLARGAFTVLYFELPATKVRMQYTLTEDDFRRGV